MIQKSITLFQHDLKNEIDIRLKLINKSHIEYAEKKSLPLSDIQKHKRYEEGPSDKSFYYKDDLILSVQNGYFHNGVSYEIRYVVNDCLI